jgi:hypothetical protein
MTAELDVEPDCFDGTKCLKKTGSADDFMTVRLRGEVEMFNHLLDFGR